MAEPKKTGDCCPRGTIRSNGELAFEVIHVVTQASVSSGKQLVEPRIAQALDQLAVIATFPRPA